MKSRSSVFLQGVIVLTGLLVFAFLLWEPHIEGRNERATWFQIYFQDPFLAYAYLASSMFFIGLYQAFRLLGLAGKQEVFSHRAVRALRIIRNCAIGMVCFVVVGEIWFILPIRDDDGPAGIVMGTAIALASTIVAVAAAMFERILQTAVEIQSENELTV